MVRGLRIVLALAAAVPAAFLPAAEWQELHPAVHPTARIGHAMALVGTDVYLFGGRPSLSAMPLDDLWRWDREAGEWVRIPPASGPWPPARSFHSMTGAGGKLLLYGGLGATSLLGDLWAFDPATGTWTQLALSGPAPRQFAALADLGEEAVFLGGGFQTSASAALSDAWELTLGSGNAVTATRLPDLPSAIYGVAAGALQGDPLVVGGMTVSGGTAVPSAAVFLLDRAAGAWEELVTGGDEPVPQGLAATVVAHVLPQEKKPNWGDVAILIGGKTTQKADASATVQLYDATANRWESLGDAPVPLSYPAGAALPPLPDDPDGLLEALVFGGADGSGAPVARTFLLTTDLVVIPRQEERVLWIPAAAHAGGVGGSVWRTDLEIHNRGGDTASVTVSLLPWNQDNSSPAAAGPFTVEPDTSLRFEDVVDALFGASTACALRIAVTGGDPIVQSRTYNQTPGGTYGQFIPAVPDSAAVPSARLVQLTGSADLSTGFRTNVGVLNVTASPIDVVIDLFDAGGQPLGSIPLTLPPYGATQVTDVFGAVGAGDVPDGWATVRTTTDGGLFVAYASVVDNRTGDPVYIEAR